MVSTSIPQESSSSEDAPASFSAEIVSTSIAQPSSSEAALESFSLISRDTNPEELVMLNPVSPKTSMQSLEKYAELGRQLRQDQAASKPESVIEIRKESEHPSPAESSIVPQQTSIRIIPEDSPTPGMDQVNFNHVIQVYQQEEDQQAFEKLRAAGAELRKSNAMKAMLAVDEKNASKAFEELRSLGAEVRTNSRPSTHLSQSVTEDAGLQIMTEDGCNKGSFEVSGAPKNECDRREIEVITSCAVDNLEPDRTSAIQAMQVEKEDASSMENILNLNRINCDLKDLSVVEAPYYESQLTYYESSRQELASTSNPSNSGVSSWMKEFLKQREIEEKAERLAEEQAQLEEKAKRQREARARQQARQKAENAKLKQELMGDAGLALPDDHDTDTAMAEYVIPDWLKKSLMLDEYAIPQEGDCGNTDRDPMEVKDFSSKEKKELLHKPPETAARPGNSKTEQQAEKSVSAPSSLKKQHSDAKPVNVDPAEIMVNAVATAMQAGLGGAPSDQGPRKPPTPLNISPEDTLRPSVARYRSAEASSQRPFSKREAAVDAHTSSGALSLPSKYMGSPSHKSKSSNRKPGSHQTSLLQPQTQESMEERTAYVQREISKAIFHGDLDRLEDVVLEALDAGIALPRSDIMMVENILHKERMEAITGQALY
eukprot:gnl/MRDRNA2_/MRDRNA2_126361_c0_seq1.p1 gnl/MRDRNA2_/MRDRNA2_126361_c0~~gnl/MRDRNA2_/MRDRNA2_126361_c0_seq1.p1  ORF type:complete len:688 (-),score=182.07 gnl/MRDRNA2_/MRDRNA2_126361_c0_seq1:8-1981(-)